MAMTVEGSQLSEQHRRDQVQLGGLIVVQILQMWAAFDVRNIDESWSRLEPAIMAVVDAGRRTSEDITQAYFRRFRAAEGVTGSAPTDLRVLQDWRTAATVSLRVTGPVTAKRLVQDHAPDPAGVALVRLSGAAMRIVENGGRDLLGNAIRRDKRAVGYQRVTAGKPCAFCAMVASRGPVFKSDRRSSAGFQAHDHCGCHAEPVYDRKTRWSGNSRRWQRLYKESTYGAVDPAKAFRHAYEAA
jgi:hypothetical protein